MIRSNFFYLSCVLFVLLTIQYSTANSVQSCNVFESRCDPKDLKSPCIPNKWFCDGEADCPNSLDELNCENKTASQKTIYDEVAHKSAKNGECENGYFKCDTNVCIPYHFVCNGKINCHDKTDEGPNCISNCECKHNGKCYMDKETSIWSCSCPPDYTGVDCSLKVDLSSRSNVAHKIVMKKSVHSKRRITNEDAFDLGNGAEASSFWLIMLIVVLMLLVVGVVLFGYIQCILSTSMRPVVVSRSIPVLYQNEKLIFHNLKDLA